MSQQEDDLRALAKIMDFLRAVSIILVVMNVYWFCYEAIRLWGVDIGVVDRILMNFNRTTGHHGFGQIGQMMGPVSGYVLKAEGFPTVYIMGDCRWEACIRDTVERFNPDYIVVNSGGAIFPEFSKTDGPIIPDENEVMQILDELPSHIKLIAVHMDAIDHCQTTRAILRNEATHHEADMSRLIIPEDGETVVL